MKADDGKKSFERSCSNLFEIRDAVIERGRTGLTITRFKGLGEMDWQELGGTTMDPDSRTLLQISVEDAAIADDVFSRLMGDDVESRRTFIQENAKDVRFLDF